MKNIGLGVVFVSFLGTLSACFGAPEDGAYADEDIGSVSEKTVAGVWGGPSVAGQETAPGTTIAVCQGKLDNGETHPGKVWDGSCNIGWAGTTKYVTDYKVLTHKTSYSWWNPVVQNQYGNWYLNTGNPANAVVGGAVGSVELPVCVGKGADNRYHPGKWYANKCNIAYGGQWFNNFGKEVKVEPGPNGAVLILIQN